jgi:hypothetical protein
VVKTGGVKYREPGSDYPRNGTAPRYNIYPERLPDAEMTHAAYKDPDIVMPQSTGTAIQALLLAAHKPGFGSPWNCA